MSQSPASAVRRTRYEDGWEAINRRIREEGSWSGRERDVFLLGGDDGTFADASWASGLDFREDGRAFGVLDLEGDGDPDLVLRNRNAPRLRVLRNRLRSGNHAIWLHLEGVRGNRDAIGARVSLETGSGRRLKHVKCGSGFLSQSTRWLWFGLGAETSVGPIEIRWPGGARQELRDLAVDRRYRIREGEAPVAEAFRPATPDRHGPETGTPPSKEALPDEAPPPADSPLAQVWLVDPLPAPEVRLPDLDGRPRRLTEIAAGPLLLLFLSPRCGACAAEVAELGAAIGSVRASGGEVVGILLGGNVSGGDGDRRWRAAPFPMLRGDEATANVWNTIHRALLNRPRDLAAPTSFLLSRSGGAVSIEKLYRGRTPTADFIRDLERLRAGGIGRPAGALPFPGTLLGPPFRRDLFLLGASLLERGATEEASRLLERALAEGALSSGGEEAEALFNLGLARSRSGDAAGARTAYERALALRPELIEARNNLGILDARAGNLEGARRRFLEVLESQPAHGEAALNLANTFLQEGRSEEAERVYGDALRADPQSRPLWCAQGYVHFLLGKIDEGIEDYRRALAISPSDPDTISGLANLLVRRGASPDLEEARRRIEAGVRLHPRHAGLLNADGLIRMIHEDFLGAEDAYRAAVAADPGEPGPRLNLARLRLKTGDRAGAAKVLEEILTLFPGHSEALSLLEQVRKK